MASKTLSVDDDRPGSQPRRMAAVELRVSGESQSSAIALGDLAGRTLEPGLGL
jgi:hypothetical protein